LLKTKIAKELDNIDESDSNELLYRDYLKATLDNIPACHGGYFSKDNNDSDDAIADEVRRILVDKDGTLSIYENSGKFNTFRFIFSKWTLKEGWDNPNIFTICKLRSSGSEISKLQEVGRGLRLPVNDTLSRVSNEQFYLNYIVDFTEKDFAYKLVNEINGDYAENTKLTSDIIKSVADSIGKTPNELFAALLTKGYIDMDKNIIVENRDSLFNEYPDLITGLKGKKIIDENNKEETPKAKIRVSKFKEIKDLWELLNRKYFISYTNITSDEIITNLLNILKDGVQGSSILIAHESTLINENGNIILSNDTNKEYENIKDNLQYNVFLNKLYQNTNIPINIIHKVLVEFNKIHKLDNNFFNTNTLTILTNRINEWKYGMLFGKFRYSSTTLSKEKTALTDSNGNPRVEVEGSLGISYSNQKPSEDYLYDICLYDSELEKKNITTDNDEVIVFGKILSLCIFESTI
jgi:type III restriction enzyme